MNTTTQTHDSVWESIVDIINNVQEKALIANSIRELLLVFLENKLPINRKDFSIIYQDYGASSPEFLIANGSKPEKNNQNQLKPFPLQNPWVLNIIQNPKTNLTYLGTRQDCIENNFPKEYQCILGIPIRLNNERNIGVFLAHSQSQENTYKELQTPLDQLSYRIAFYIRSNIIERRSERFKNFYNNLNKSSYKQETEILSALVSGLKNWFCHEKINIILINPFNTNEYLLACKDDIVNENFRNSKSLTQDDLKPWIGNMLPILTKKPKILNSIVEIQQHDINSDCKSWLGARMQTTSDRNIGFIVLENFVAEHSYEIGEERLVDNASDWAAVILTEHRKNQREKSLARFKDMLLLERLPSDVELYNKAQATLNELYGTVFLAIIRTNHITKKLELAKNTINHFEIDIEFEQKLKEYLEDYLKDNEKKNLSIEHPKLGTLLATPMKSSNNDLGCFLIPSAKCGPLTTRYIEDLSDIISVIMDKQGKENIRLDLLKSFSEKVSRIQKITKEEIIRITHKYVAEAMFSENFYIALYNKEKNEISFPFIIKNGKPLNTPPRQLDKEKRGKTEEIILTGNAILHKTKAESTAWYDQPKHEEFIGNPLASWIGVPILSPDGVSGVIAAYHPDEEFVYTQGDLFFLQMLSNPVSGLFRALSLEDAQVKIAESERQMATSLLAQDMIHNLNGSISPIAIKIQEGIDSIEAYQNNHNSNLLIDSIKDLSKAYKSTLNLLDNIKNITSMEKEDIDVVKIIENIATQVRIAKRLNSLSIRILPSQNLSDLTLNTHKRIFSNTIYSIVSNAADAIIDALDSGKGGNELFIEIAIENRSNNLIIDITDNGHPAPIPEEQVGNLFKYGYSTKKNNHMGYGLWRAKSYIKGENGNIELFVNDNNKKTFRITLPLFSDKKIAVVIDDQEDWIEILSKWLSTKDYAIKSASCLNEAYSLIDEIKKEKTNIELVFLDVSLDKEQSRNVDGLDLIERFKQEIHPTVISLVTAYPEYAYLYEKSVDLIIPKVNNGLPLNQKSFLASISTFLSEKKSKS